MFDMKTTATECPECNGKGKYFSHYYPIQFGITPIVTRCDVCNGSGKIRTKSANTIEK